MTMLPGVMEVSMDVGVFGKQALPTAISTLVFWPVLIPQIYGLVQQNELDKEAYRVNVGRIFLMAAFFAHAVGRKLRRSRGAPAHLVVLSFRQALHSA